MSFEYSKQRSPFWIQGLEVRLSEEEMARCLSHSCPPGPSRKISFLIYEEECPSLGLGQGSRPDLPGLR